MRGARAGGRSSRGGTASHAAPGRGPTKRSAPNKQTTNNQRRYPAIIVTLLMVCIRISNTPRNEIREATRRRAAGGGGGPQCALAALDSTRPSSRLRSTTDISGNRCAGRHLFWHEVHERGVTGMVSLGGPSIPRRDGPPHARAQAVLVRCRWFGSGCCSRAPAAARGRSGCSAFRAELANQALTWARQSDKVEPPPPLISLKMIGGVSASTPFQHLLTNGKEKSRSPPPRTR